MLGGLNGRARGRPIDPLKPNSRFHRGRKSNVIRRLNAVASYWWTEPAHEEGSEDNVSVKPAEPECAWRALRLSSAIISWKAGSPKMRIDGKAEVQHYVPQVLLRLHIRDASAKRGSEQVWCFDKKTDKVFSPNIRGVLAESRFYEIESRR